MTDASFSRLTRCVIKLIYLQRTPLVGGIARLVLLVLGIDIPARVRIAPGLRLGHPTAGVVVHPSTTIDRDVTLFHGVTLGRTDAWRAEPSTGLLGGIEIGAEAVVCAGAVVLFRPGTKVSIGEGAVIGANAVVTTDVPAGETWAGNPASKVQPK